MTSKLARNLAFGIFVIALSTDVRPSAMQICRCDGSDQGGGWWFGDCGTQTICDEDRVTCEYEWCGESGGVSVCGTGGSIGVQCNDGVPQ